MPRDDIKTVTEFYGDWNSVEILCERQLLFTRLRRLDRLICVAEITEEIRLNHALADMAPNYISVLKTYIVLPSTACEAERSFYTLRRLKSFLRSTQTQFNA